MKIAITGSACIGKSTLALKLAEKLEVGLIKENYQSLENVKSMDDFAEKLIYIQQQKLLQEDQGSFVSDRCPIDLMHLWLYHEFHLIQSESDTFIQSCIQQVRQYDFIIIPPWNSFKLEQNAQGTRVINSLTQLRNHATLVGYTHMFCRPKSIIEIPQSVNTCEERVNLIIAVIKQRRPEFFHTAL